MLVLTRYENQWVDIVHRSGDVIRVQIQSPHSGQPGNVRMVFDDPDQNFQIQRPERVQIKPWRYTDGGA